MSDDKQDKPKIIIDSDWKEQARKEKEELSKEAESKAQAKQSATGAPPKPDFVTHCASLATQAMISMGAIAHPATGQAQIDLNQARYVVDTLELLKEKTAGNLSDEESETLDSLIGELKMVWAQVVQAIKDHQAKQGEEGQEA